MPDEPIPFATVEEALEEIRQGRQIVLVDDEDRENEGDLTMAAEKITPEAVNFMAKNGRGLICLALTEERCDELALPPMTPVNTSNYGTAFTESIDARRGTTTGISAADRATTILAAIDPATRPADLARPGHIFPLRARNGGVLVRAGQTEASVDLARIAGLYSRRRDLRNHERRRHDGAPAATRGVLPRARPEAADRGGTDPLPHAQRALRAPRGRSRSANALRRFPHDRLCRATWTASSTSPWFAAISTGRRRWCACTRTASPATSLRPPSAIATKSSSARSKRLSREDRGVFVYLHHTGRGFGIERRAGFGRAPHVLYHSREQLDRGRRAAAPPAA